MVRFAFQICCALILSGYLAAVTANSAKTRPILPERVFPNLPEPMLPADFLAMSLYLRTDTLAPTYQRTGLTLREFLAVLPSGRKWRKSTSENGWGLTLAELSVGTDGLEEVAIIFVEDNMAAPRAVGA
jgi:hypothetical protein